MEETNTIHVLTQHPVITFAIGAIFVFGVLFLVAKLATRYFGGSDLMQSKDKHKR